MVVAGLVAKNAHRLLHAGALSVACRAVAVAAAAVPQQPQPVVVARALGVHLRLVLVVARFVAQYAHAAAQGSARAERGPLRPAECPAAAVYVGQAGRR